MERERRDSGRDGEGEKTQWERGREETVGEMERERRDSGRDGEGKQQTYCSQSD